MTITSHVSPRRLGAVLLAGVAATSLALGAVNPASADPVGSPTYRVLPGVGSDTIQDVTNGLAQRVNFDTVKVIGSYNATGSSTIQTTLKSTAFHRPDGSTEGVAALSSAVSTTATDTYHGVKLGYDQVKFARSSSGPVAPDPTNGPLQYIPLAADAVTYATSSNSVIPSGIPQGTSSQDAVGTVPDVHDVGAAALTLRNIFQGHGYLKGDVNGTTYRFYVGGGASANSNYTKLNVYVPQSGSGTRSFWASTLGFSSNPPLPAGVSDTFVSGGVTTSVQEHDGSALVGDANAIAPFSVAQWIAQNKAVSLTAGYGVTVIDRRHGALLNSVGSAAPLKSDGTLDPSFPIARPVFIVVEYAAVDPTNAAYNPFLARTFVTTASTTAKVFGDATITNFGFGALDPNGTTIGGTTYKPGELNSSLRSDFKIIA